jgi:hypothetical protein
MTAHALLNAGVVERKSPRYIFRRRGLMTAGSTTIQIKTLDVSEHGFGVLATEPVKIGKACSIILNNGIGENGAQQTFSCEIVYCILTGVHGFRIGLHLNTSSVELQKQLQKIIANCSPSFV